MPSQRPPADPDPTAGSRPRRGRPADHPRFAAVVAAVALLAGGAGVAGAGPASASVRCTVDFTTPMTWNSGFSGGATIRNTGDRVDGWTLTWTFASGERLLQGWNGDYTSSGASVTVTNPAWARTIATGASFSTGFNASHTGTVSTPIDVRLNGTACTVGGATPAPSATPTATATATATPKPTATPAPTATATATPTPTPSATPKPTATPTPTPTPVPVAWAPPAALTGALAEVWAHQESTYSNLYGFTNYGWDQVIANGGYLNACVRWDSDQPVSVALRDAIEAKYTSEYAKWFATLVENGQGWNGWPYTDVKVRVVGWAVRDRAQLQWTDSSRDIYVNDIREDAPQCAESRGRFFHQDGVYPGGVERHYDQSLWLTKGMSGGAGGDWGQRMGSEYFVSALTSSDVTILQHEIGHTFGLDDFYDWTPTGQTNFVMMAGSSQKITPFDAWMLRDWWRHLKPRYGM